MDLITALDTIESFDQGIEAYHEMLADLGSSFFMGGASGNGGYDALTLARNELGPMPDEDDPELREARATVAYYESINPLTPPRKTRRLNAPESMPPISVAEANAEVRAMCDEAEEYMAERRYEYLRDGDGLDAPDGWYR